MILDKAVALPKYLKMIRNRELQKATIYITERCNSRCLTCNIWQKKNPKDMSVEMIKDIVSNNIFIVLQGGEPLLHPKIDEILTLLQGHDYQMFSNGILADKLYDYVIRYHIPQVALSCDGTGEFYKKARGVDNYKNVERLVKALSKITTVEVSYIVSPWNNREELLKVHELCKENGAHLHIDVYAEMKYFNTVTPRMEEIYKADDCEKYPSSKVLRTYSKWIKGDAEAFCHSVRFSCFITTDGGVYACGRKMTKSGDLNTQSLREIWKSENTLKVQNELRHCNYCWATCYRNIDVALNDVLPKFILERL